MRSKPVLVITPGDPHGIGPEVVWKALSHPQNRKRWSGFSLLCVGAREPFDRLGAPVIEARIEGGKLCAPVARTGVNKPSIWLYSAPLRSPKKTLLPGYQSGWAIQQAAALIQSGQAQALVTGPISKERLRRGG